MNKNLFSDDDENDIGDVNLPRTRYSKEKSESSDETAIVHGIFQPQTRPGSRDLTASHLAKVIVWAFCLGMGCSFLFASVHYFSQLNSDESSPDINVSLEIFKTISATMSGPLGFVLGFYFRENK